VHVPRPQRLCALQVLTRYKRLFTDSPCLHCCTDDIVPSVQVLKHRQTQLEEAISENGGSFQRKI